jgi:putative transposase
MIKSIYPKIWRGYDTLLFFKRKNVPEIIGDKAFRHWLNELLKPMLDAEDRGRSIRPGVTMEEVITAVAEIYKTTEIEITEVYKGPQSGSKARKVAMYLCQELTGATLSEIARVFNLTHPGSVSFITHQIRHRKPQERKLKRLIDRVIGVL